MSTARELVAASHDADSVSMRVLGHRLGVSAAAIYRYFPDRDSVLRAVCVSILVDLADELERAGSPSEPGEALVSVGSAYLQFVCTHAEEMRLVRHFRDDNDPTALEVFVGIDVDPLASSLARAVASCAHADVLARDADQKLVADALYAALSGLATRAFLCDRNDSKSFQKVWSYTVECHLSAT